MMEMVATRNCEEEVHSSCSMGINFQFWKMKKDCGHLL